jgi:RNA polymerase sigma factor (sigma-70 family)
MARSRIEIEADAVEHQPDSVLAERAATGDREAFEELYRRHSRTAMRVAYRVTGNIHDAADAVSDAFARVMLALPQGRLADPARFRSYLLTSTRHAAVDVLRRAGPAIPTDEEAEPVETLAGPHEKLIDAADSSLVAAAFRALPERWRSVLWLTEVEGIPAREAAPMLGVSANGVAQLAVRARAGLRERYLQAHLREVDGACSATVSRLGAYVGGGLASRDIALVDQHVAACPACRQREGDLQEIGTTLRRSFAPIPAAGAATAAAGLWRLAERAYRALIDLGASGSAAATAKVAPVGMAAAGVLVAGLAGVGVVNHRVADAATPHTASPALVAPAAAPLSEAPVALTTQAQQTAIQTQGQSQVQTRQARTITAPGTKAQAQQTTAAPTRAPRQPAGDSPAGPTTTTTAPSEPIADHTDSGDGTTTTTSITLPELPVPTTLPVAGEVVDTVVDALSDLPLITALRVQEFLDSSAIDFSGMAFDAPLPSPEAAGLPV